VSFGHRATPLTLVVGIFRATVFSQLHYPLYLHAAIGPRSPWIVNRHAVYQARVTDYEEICRLKSRLCALLGKGCNDRPAFHAYFANWMDLRVRLPL
jgi:hypothetical protein